MKICYKARKFRPDSLLKIKLANEIIALYDGIKLTLRQLYYQFVIRNVIENKESAYKNLGSLISNARDAGEIDWEAIEDRIRKPRLLTEFDDIPDLIAAAKSSYRLPRWEGQDWYIELWTEKDALSNILAPMADKYHIVQMVNRGFGSSTSMHDTALRFLAEEDKKYKALLYLGDFDPSGEEMVRDINKRMSFYGVKNCHVEKIALTLEQVKQYKLLPNPVKKSDSRAKAFIAKYGESSWEVDALPPDVLHRMIEQIILKVLDLDKYNKVIEQEDSDKELLDRFVDNIIQGKSLPTRKLGRKPLNYNVKNVCDTLLSTHSIDLAAKELNCSRGYIYQVLKQRGMTPKGVLNK